MKQKHQSEAAGGQWRQNESLIPINILNIIIKSHIFQSNSKRMKQINKRSQEKHNLQQNHSPNGSRRFLTNFEPQNSVKLREFPQVSSEIPFKKQEASSKYGQKQCALESKGKSQASQKAASEQLKCCSKKDLVIFQKSWRNDKSAPNCSGEQNDNLQKGKKVGRSSKPPKNTVLLRQAMNDSSPKQSFLFNNTKQCQRTSKKEAKLLKKIEKEKQAAIEIRDSSEDSPLPQNKHQQSFSQEIISLFQREYPYYLLNGHIVFPIEDALFRRYPQLNQQPSSHPIDKSAYLKQLNRHFKKQLQIWNMIVEHPAFFAMTEDVTVGDVSKILKGQNTQAYRQLFKALHNFFINDVLFHRYDEFATQDCYAFVSLWRYAQENGFLDKVFQTCWNKFMLFYISLQKTGYKLEDTIRESEQYSEYLRDSVERGLFDHPQGYGELLDYLIYLNNTSFQTVTFKALINNKMMFFRDNNKAKNEMLEQKKSLENSLWELKQVGKGITKKEKSIFKAIKKEQKTKNQQQIDQLTQQLQAINTQKEEMGEQRLVFNNKINEIENKIYELCCLPEFSNVWLLGEDGDRNLYWFIKEQDNAIYMEDRLSGQWSIISNGNIDVFHNTLNQRGIREKKLYEKILYYKQLGYIKTDATASMQEIIEDYYDNGNDQSNEMKDEAAEDNDVASYVYDASQFDKFSYADYGRITPRIIKLMILKSEWMMTKYLYERNSKWTHDESRNQFIHKMLADDFTDLDGLTQELRTFNEKICVVEINIKIVNQLDAIDLKTRKIQTKIWGINEKYKHFWYEYSRKCRTMSDLHFLVSVLYLTIEKYVTKTRKPNNTKYFFKTVEFGQANEQLQQLCDTCKNVGELQVCMRCDCYFHGDCLMRHQQNDGCTYRGQHQEKLCIFD